MAKDKRVFTGGMDKDSDPRLIKNGDYRHAENIRNIASSDGTSGSVENIESTVKVPYSFKGEDVDKIIVVDEGKASVIPQKSVFYSQSITFEFMSYTEDWVNKERNSFTIYSYTPERELKQVGHRWSVNGNLRWSEHSFKPTSEHIWDMFNEETGLISKNIPIINLNTGEWETAHSKVDIPIKSFVLGGGRKISVEIIADKKGVPFLLDFSSPGSDRYWTQSIEDYPPYGRINLTGGPNSVIYSSLVLSSQSSFYSEDTNSQNLDEFVDVDGNSFDNDVPTPIEGDTITEYTLSFEGEEPTSPQDANEIQIFSYTENSLGDFEVAPFFSFGDGLYNSGQTYEFNSNQSSLSNSLHDSFEKFEGKVLHKGETAIDGSLDAKKGQISLGFSKGESLKGNNFSEIKNSANASANDFGLFKGFYNSDSLGDYASQSNIQILNGEITLTESSLAKDDSWRFPVKLNKNNAYLVQADVSNFNASSAVLDVKIPSSSRSANRKDLKSSDSDLSISGVNNNFEWLIPASDVEANSSFLEVDFISGAIEEDESVTIKNLRVSKLKESSFKLDISLRSLTDFNLCFGSSEESVLASLRAGGDLSKQEEFVDGSVFAKLSLERKQGKNLDYVSDQLIDAQEKIKDLNNVISGLNLDLKNLKESYNDTLKDVNLALPEDSRVVFTLFNELENKSSVLANTIIEVNNQVDTFTDLIGPIISPEQQAKIESLTETVNNLEEEINALNQASQVAAAQALLDIEAAKQQGIDSVTQEDGVTQADVDAVQALLDVANESLTAALEDVETYNDGITKADVDAVQALLDAANTSISNLETKVSDLTETEASLTSQLSDKQQKVLDTQALLDTANANLAIADDGITQTDVNNAVTPIKTLLTQAQTTINAVDPNDGLADSVVDSFQDLITTALATLTTQKNLLGTTFNATQTSSDIADINASITALQAEIVRLQGNQEDGVNQSDVDTAVTNLKDILVNASTVTLEGLTSTDAATQALLDAISSEVTDASTIITDAITKIEKQKQDAANDAVTGLYTLTQLNEEYIKGYIKGTTLVEPEGGASQADTDGKIAAAIAAANSLIETRKATSFTEGVNSIIEEDGINRFHITNAYNAGVTAGKDEVDITSDNAAAYANGVSAVQNSPSAYSLYSESDYADNFAAGVNSVDLTILGNPEIAIIAGEQYAAGVTATQELFNSNLAIELTPEQAQDAGLVWAQGIRDGFFGEGVASVDITSDNQSVYDGAYADGKAAGKLLGAASVDLTVNNPAIKLISESAYADGAASVTQEDGVSQADVDAVQGKLDSLNSLIGALPTSYTDSASITTAVNDVQTTLNIVVDTKSSLITSLVNAFNAGEASVDITTDNQTAIDSAVAKIDTALTNAKTDLKILESDLTVITKGTKEALQSLLNAANTKITSAKDATDLAQADLDAIEASLSAANLLLDATEVKTDSETGEIINNTQASLNAVIAELADLKNQIFGFDSEKYANVQEQVNAAVAAAADTMYASVAAAVETVASILQPSTGIDISNVNQAVSVVLGTIASVDGITQAQTDSAHTAAAASITSSDGITEAEVATALEAAVTDYSGAGTTFTSAQIKDAVRQITLKITPEDGVTQADVDAVQTSLETAISTLRTALGLSADETADTAANISALTTKISELNAAQAALTELQNSAAGVDPDFTTAAGLISNYSALKLSKENLEIQMSGILNMLNGVKDSVSEDLIPESIKNSISELQTAQQKLQEIIDTTGSSIDSVSSTVTTLYNNSLLVTEARNYISSLRMSTTFADTTGIQFDSTTGLYNAPGEGSLSYGLEAGGVIGAIPQGFLDPIDPSTSTELFYLLKSLTDTYNLLYDNYSTLYTDYNELEGLQSSLVQKTQLDSVQDNLNQVNDALNLANDSLSLLYGGSELENYIGNGSFNNDLTSGWNNLYDSANAATNFWVVEDEMLKRSPYTGGGTGGVNYTGSEASGAKKVTDGKYIFSVNLKSLGKGDQYNNDSIYVTVLDTLNNVYINEFKANGLGYHTAVFAVDNISEDVYFKLGISYNGNNATEFNLGIDDIQLIKVPEVNYSQDTLDAFISKIAIQNQLIEYKNLEATLREDILQAEIDGHAKGAASVTPEDGVSQADVDAAVAAVDITTDNQATVEAAVLESLQRIAIALEGHQSAATVDLSTLIQENNWQNIKDLSIQDLKDNVFEKIDSVVQFGGLSEEAISLIGGLSANDYIISVANSLENVKLENSILKEDVAELNTSLASFVSFFSQSLISIRNQNDGPISEFVETLSFTSDYAGSTGVFTDGVFSINNFKVPNDNFFAGASTFVDIEDLEEGWAVGNLIYNQDNTFVGTIQSIGSPDSDNVSRVTFTTTLQTNVRNWNRLYNKKINQIVTDGEAIESILKEGDLIHFKSTYNDIVAIGEIKLIENGPDYHATNNPNERLITFIELLDIDIPDNTEILFNSLLSDLRSEFEVNATSVEDFIQSILGEVSSLSNISEEANTLKQMYRFTLFGTPNKSIPALDDVGDLFLNMRNPDIPGYTNFQTDPAIRILKAGSDYGENQFSEGGRVAKTIIGNVDNFSNKGNITIGGTEDSDLDFTYFVIPTEGDSLGTILKLKLLYNSEDINNANLEGMDISNLDVIDIDGNAIDRGFSLFVSVIKGESANKWEFALSNDKQTNIFKDSKVQWEIARTDDYRQDIEVEGRNPLVDNYNSNLSIVTNYSDQVDWTLNEYTSGQGWAFNSDGYFEGVNGGTVSGNDGGGFNQANTLSLPLDLKPNTTYEVKFIKGVEFDEFEEELVVDGWAVPNTFDIAEISSWQSSLNGIYPDNYQPLLGTYWTMNPSNEHGNIKHKVGVFSPDGSATAYTSAYKGSFQKVRPVAVVSGVPSEYRSVGSLYANGIVYSVSGLEVKIVSLTDAVNDFESIINGPDSFSRQHLLDHTPASSFDHKFEDGTTFNASLPSDRFQIKFNLTVNDEIEFDSNGTQSVELRFDFQYKYVRSGDSNSVTSKRRFSGYFNADIDATGLRYKQELITKIVSQINAGNYDAVFGLGPEGGHGYNEKDGISVFGKTGFTHSTQGFVTPAAPHSVIAIETSTGVDIALASNYISATDSASDVSSAEKIINNNSKWVTNPYNTSYGFDGITKSSTGRDVYIRTILEEPDKHQFATTDYFDPVTNSRYVGFAHASWSNIKDDLSNLSFSITSYSASDNQKEAFNYFYDLDIPWNVPALLICNKYISYDVTRPNTKMFDLKASFNSGPGVNGSEVEIQNTENNLATGFRGEFRSLRINHFSRQVDTITSEEAIYNYWFNYGYLGSRYGDIDDNTTIITEGIRITTGPNYDSSKQGAGKLVIQPGHQGFRGKFYGVQVEELQTNLINILRDTSFLSILGEKIISAETHNVINQSPVYGTALSNAYNSNKTLIRNNNTGNVDVTPLIEGGYVCVGAYEDKPKNKIYYFVSEEVKDKKRDSILEYDLMNDKITTVYQDDVGSSSGDSNIILNFSESHLITGVNKVDDILYFTDNLNRPRKINVELAKANEENISNPLYTFQDTFFRTFESTVFVGGDNEHPLVIGDHIYTQYDSTTDKNSCFNGYAKVLGVTPKLNQGVTIAINKGDTSATLSSADHGLTSSNIGEFLSIIDGTLPHYYKIVSISGATIGLENPYNESNKTEAKSLNIDGLNVSGIITDCPFGNSVSSSQGKIFYANPKGAYSPLITFGEYESKIKYFDVVKHQPTYKPSIEMVKDSSVATNNIIDNVFQFKYRYNHTDEENTAYSPISDVAIDGSYATNAPINAYDFNLVKNRIDVSYDDAISDVEFIEIVGRKGNDGKFFLIESVPNNFINYLKGLKNSLILESEDEYVIDKSSIKFYNNGVYPFIDESDSNKLFDAVPIKAKAQTILSNNRLAYGNVVEGYDNTDLAIRTTFSSEEAPILESQVSDVLFSPTIPSGFRENATGYDHKQGYGKATFNPTVDLNNIDLNSDKSQFLELDFNSVFRFDVKNNLKRENEYRSSNFYGAWRVTGISTVQELADFVVGQINNGDFVGGTGSKKTTNNTNKATVSASSNSSGQVTIRFKWTKANKWNGGNIHHTKLQFKSQTIAGKFTSGTVGVGSFKSGAFHNFGIAYFDETNRCSFVNTAPAYSNVKLSEEKTESLNGTRAYNPFYTEPSGPDLGQGSSVSLEIYNQAPDWAKSYQVYYTGSNTVEEFVQMTVTRAEHGASGSGDDQMYLSLNSLKGKNYSYNQTNNSQVEYNFVPGDRVRFISCIKNGNRLKFNEYIDLEIGGEDLFQGTDNPIGDEGGYYIRINDPKNDSVKIISNDGETTDTVDLSTTGSRSSVSDSGYNGLIVEIYRPKKNLEEEFMVYYEVGEKHAISNRFHGGDSSQGGNFTVDEASGVLVSDVPATVNINAGDVYLKPRTMFTSGDNNGENAETFFPEDYNLNDFHDTNHYSRGRINVINTNSKARRLDASVYYSEPYSSTGSINGFSSFNLATQPYFDYNKAFGSIQSLQTKDDDLIIFHENKVGRVLVGKDVLNTASGDGLVSLSRDIIKNYVTVYSGDYGCCLQPESIVKNDDKFYFMDIKKGAVLRLSNDGITPISDYGMRDYFRDIGEMYVEYDPETQDNQVFNIVAGFDPKYNEYIVTLPAVYDKSEGLWNSDVKTWNSKSDRFSVVSPQKIFFAKTVAFNEDLDRWTSFYGFYPEFYSRVNNQFVGFQAGYMFKHNMTDRYYQDLYLNSPIASKSSPNYNFCYDKVLDSTIEFPFNAEPDTVKNYNAISLNSDTKLFTEMKTNIGQTGVGEDNYGGYDNVISSGIGFRKVKGEVQSVNGKYLVGNTNSSIGEVCKFFEDLHKGDVIRIIGKKNSEDLRSFPSYAIVRSISSNSLLTLNKELELAVVSHVEVIDYKTKEGIQYSQIPFVSSMDFESETLGFNGDGSELSLVGSVNSFEYSDDPGVFTSILINNIFKYSGYDIPASSMITGAKYALIKVGDNDGFNINNVSMGVEGGYQNLPGEVFTCSSQSSSTTTMVRPITDRAFIQNIDNGEITFVGYPFLPVGDGMSSLMKLRVSLSDEGKAFVSSNPTGNFVLFLAKDGNIEGERLKGSYMMTTLTTKSPSSTSKSDLPKYKFNLYSASVDVDKSELSGE